MEGLTKADVFDHEKMKKSLRKKKRKGKSMIISLKLRSILNWFINFCRHLKHKLKKKTFKDYKTTSSSSSSSPALSPHDNESRKFVQDQRKSLEELRAERLAREKQEKEREAELLKKFKK